MPAEVQPAVVIAECSFERGVTDPEVLLRRYHTLVGWAEALVRAGAGRVAVVQRFGRDALLRRGSVDYHFVSDGEAPFPGPPFWGWRMTRLIRALRPDVVHVDGLLFPFLVRHLRLALPRRTSILVQDHGGIHADSAQFRSRRRRLFYRMGLAAADGFMFTTREQARPWQQAGMIGGKQTIYEVLEGSTDLADRFAGAPSTRLLPGRPALFWVGRLDENKDPLTVLRGFELAMGALPDARLSFAYGLDTLLPEINAKLASSSDLRARVNLLGKVERGDLAPLYASADVFVLGSHYEAACHSLLEALSFGSTPVVTDIPAFRRLTDSGRMGKLFPPGDPAALARALTSLADMDRQASRARVLGYFRHHLSWTVVGQSAWDAYRDAVRARSLVA